MVRIDNCLCLYIEREKKRINKAAYSNLNLGEFDTVGVEGVTDPSGDLFDNVDLLCGEGGAIKPQFIQRAEIHQGGLAGARRGRVPLRRGFQKAHGF